MMKEPPNPLRAIHRDLNYFIFKSAGFRKSLDSRVIEKAKHGPALIVGIERGVLVVGPILHAISILVIKQNGAAVYIAQGSDVKSAAPVSMPNGRSRANIAVRGRIIRPSPVNGLPRIGLQVQNLMP